MNDFLKRLAPSTDRIGLLRTVERICPKHGPYQARIYGYVDQSAEFGTSETSCDLCREEDDRMGIINGYVRSKLLEMTGRIGIAPRFAHCDFDNYWIDGDEMKKASISCQELAVGSVSALVLCGPTGRGKTHLLVATLKEAVRRGDSALYVTEAMIYRHIRESYLNRKDCMTESQVIDRYSGVRVLGIDEIGRSSWTEHESRILGEIITNRYNNQFRTMMATNLFPDKLHGYFDDAILRKLSAREITTPWPRFDEEATA